MELLKAINLDSNLGNENADEWTKRHISHGGMFVLQYKLQICISIPILFKLYQHSLGAQMPLRMTMLVTMTRLDTNMVSVDSFYQKDDYAYSTLFQPTTQKLIGLMSYGLQLAGQIPPLSLFMVFNQTLSFVCLLNLGFLLALRAISSKTPPENTRPVRKVTNLKEKPTHGELIHIYNLQIYCFNFLSYRSYVP